MMRGENQPSKPYDAAAKTLLGLNPRDWLAFLGIVTDAPIEILDSDLSTVSLAVDGLLKIDSASPYGVHIEAESGHTGKNLPERAFRYNFRAHEQTGLAFRSFLVLLTKKANSPALTGTWEIKLPDGTLIFRFHYEIVRLYELSPDRFLTAGLSLVPLTLLGSVSPAEAPEIVARMKARITSEAKTPEQEQELLAATYLLNRTGAKYSAEFTDALLKGAIQNMLDLRESSTYRKIRREAIEEGLAEGRAEGRAEGLTNGLVVGIRETIFRIGEKRLGTPPETIRSVLTAIASPDILTEIAGRLLEVNSWDELVLA